MPRINKMCRSGLHRQKRFGNRGTGSQYIRTPTNINATRMMLAVRAIKSYTVAVLLPARLHRAAQSRSGGRRKARALRTQLVSLTLGPLGRHDDGEGATAEGADAAVGERWLSHSTSAHADELGGQAAVVVQT